ncbi:MAG: erythromycin esterase family protein [Methylophaga sp.]|nr:erythromycin esterase family protein [Methylophaga sp.]
MSKLSKAISHLMLALTSLMSVTAFGDVLSQQISGFETIEDFQPILSDMADKRLILLGESTHGTAEFYEKRAAITQSLIEEHGFDFVAVEGDWASIVQLNLYVKHDADGPQTLEEAMNHLQRWPQWMWRNAETQALIRWLRDYNRDLPATQRVGIYGIDVYADELAAQDVVAYFEVFSPREAVEVAALYQCKYQYDSVSLYLESVWQSRQHCGDEIDQVLHMIQQRKGFDPDNWQDFRAEQAALVVKHAEWHYRGELEGGALSWNRRANHFYLTTQRLMDFYGENSRGIVWAHNTHIGDARATEMARHGLINIGQLAREQLGKDASYALGMGTYQGEVLAALSWEAEMQVMNIPMPRTDSWEAMLNNFQLPQLWVRFDEKLAANLQNPMPHRGIGVTYDPSDESRNYDMSVLPARYDGFVFFRDTRPLTFLE